jgi:HSP20 family protein
MAEKEKPTKKEEKALAPRGGGLVPFEEMERWFDEVAHRWLSPFESLFPSFPELRVPFEGRMPQVDMFDREAEIVIRAALPGVAKEDLELSMTDETVTIRASTRREAKEEKGAYYRRELSQGEFQRTLRLPVAVKGAEAKATFKDGILELVLPKVEQAKPKKITIE